MNAIDAFKLSQGKSYASYLLKSMVMPGIKRRVEMGIMYEVFYFDGSETISNDQREKLAHLLMQAGYKVNDNGFAFRVDWS